MVNLPETSTLFCTQNGYIFTITLNRRKKLNAFNEDMFNDLEQIIKIISNTPEIRVVIITGAGKAFSSGGDIDDMLKYHHQSEKIFFEKHLQYAQSVFNLLEALKQPTIAAINGSAMGAGFQIALACDFRILAEEADMGLKDVKIGIIPALGASTRLVELIGLSKAKELILLGDPINSKQALAMGLVTYIVPGKELNKTVLNLAEKLIANAPLAVFAAKNLLNSKSSLVQAAKVQIELFKTFDAGEGITSFLEKRRPSFVGS